MPKKGYRQLADGHILSTYPFGEYFAVVGNSATIGQLNKALRSAESPPNTPGGTYYNRSILPELPFGGAIIFYDGQPDILSRLDCVKDSGILKNPGIVGLLNQVAEDAMKIRLERSMSQSPKPPSGSPSKG